MKQAFKKRSRKAGMRPGSLIHIGHTYAEKSKISLIRYDEASITEKEIHSGAQLAEQKSQPGILWVNIDGLQDVQLLEAVKYLLGLQEGS